MTFLTQDQLLEQVQDSNFAWIMKLLKEGKTKTEIANILCIAPWKVAHQVHQAFEMKIIIPDAIKYAPHNDIQAVDYSKHDEYNRHYAGCEFEDTRPPNFRGLDWPPNGNISSLINQ